VELIDISTCKRNLVIEVSREEVDDEIHKLAQKYAERVRVPGFRPGKAPLVIIKQRFAAELKSEVTQELIKRHWKTALSDHSLRPLTQPVVEHIDAEPGNPLRFTLSFEVLPPLEVKDYKGVSVPLSEPVVSESDVDQVLESLREQNAQLVPVDEGEIRDGHVVTLAVDGEFEGGGKALHEEDVVCTIGDPGTNSAFSENLRGARVGDELQFNVPYPAEDQRKRFAGKTVRYRVLVKEVKEKHLAELNDDFAKDVGGLENLEELRARIRDDLISKARVAAEKDVREAILNQVVQRHFFDVPESLVREELEDRARRIATQFVRRGIDVNDTSIDWKKIFEGERPHAEQTVRRTLILDAIARQEGIEVLEAELEEEVRTLAETAKKSPVALRAQLEKDQRIQSVKEHLRRKKALDFICRNANISRG